MFWFISIAASVCLLSLAVAFWSVHWPTTKGQINISIFDQEWEASSSRNSVTLEKQDKFYLSYVYSVDGIDYASGRIAPLAELDWHIGNVDSSARNKSRWYREGANIDVYYCPFWPAWSCLEPGGFFMTALLVVISLLSGVFLHSAGLIS